MLSAFPLISHNSSDAATEEVPSSSEQGWLRALRELQGPVLCLHSGGSEPPLTTKTPTDQTILPQSFTLCNAFLINPFPDLPVIFHQILARTYILVERKKKVGVGFYEGQLGTYQVCHLKQISFPQPGYSLAVKA